MKRCLIACEFSGVVRNGFAAQGWDAWSCDLLPSETPGNHLQCDVREALACYPWDLLLAFPPCTHLAVSGARWFKDKQAEQAQALEFVRMLLNAPVYRICLENPIGVISTHIRKPSQIIQPWQFGEPFQKATCLWLKNLPLLKPTNIISERKQQCWLEPPSPDRWKKRSKTYQGIANAMAAQWGAVLTNPSPSNLVSGVED